MLLLLLAMAASIRLRSIHSPETLSWCWVGVCRVSVESAAS